MVSEISEVSAGSISGMMFMVSLPAPPFDSKVVIL